MNRTSKKNRRKTEQITKKTVEECGINEYYRTSNSNSEIKKEKEYYGPVKYINEKNVKFF